MIKNFFFFCFFTLHTLLLFGEIVKKPIVFMIGTRPEAIKVLPVYRAFKEANLPVLICSTGQHLEMVDEVMKIFDSQLDENFMVMKPQQDLIYLTNTILEKSYHFLKSLDPALVLVQGDTTTAMSAALASFYLQIPIAHIEAGLRTYNLYRPFPEEMNRQVIGKLASLHFTPTLQATEQLKREGVNEAKIYQTGNTVVDALFFIQKQIENRNLEPSASLKKMITSLKDNNQALFLFTIHRRESLDGGIKNVMETLYTYLNNHKEMTILYPAHPNPLIREIIQTTKLNELDNLVILDPLPYHDLVYILSHSQGVLTDSGGIQEEAISLMKPTLILRDETDRPEGLTTGLAELVGTNPELIQLGIDRILASSAEKDIENKTSPYGDGLASERIVKIVKNFLNL